MKEPVRRLILSILSAICLFFAILAQFNPVPDLASRTTQQIMATTAVTYVSLRTLNAFLSTAQEVEVGGAFVVQGTAQPFKVLEPIDDTVERVASVIFVISGIAAVLTVAFTPVASIGLILISAGLLARAHFPNHQWVPSLEAIKYGAMLGLVLPGVFILSGLLADRMTERVWSEHDEILTRISQEIQSEDPGADVISGAAPAPSSFWGTIVAERTRDTFEALSGYREAARIIVQQADELIESFFNIIAVFFFKIVILPLVLYGLYLALVRRL